MIRIRFLTANQMSNNTSQPESQVIVQSTGTDTLTVGAPPTTTPAVPPASTTANRQYFHPEDQANLLRRLVDSVVGVTPPAA